MLFCLYSTLWLAEPGSIRGRQHRLIDNDAS